MATPWLSPIHWQKRPSPNHSPRTAGRAIDTIVLHADASGSVLSTLDWCARKDAQVSYHIVVGRTGLVYELVSPDRVAWHAGVSHYDGRDFVNGFSVGVCLSNRNDGKEPYPDRQLDAGAEVCATLIRHYQIPVERITTHAHVARPVGRKDDPKGLDVVLFRSRVAALVRMAASGGPGSVA